MLPEFRRMSSTASVCVEFPSSAVTLQILYTLPDQTTLKAFTLRFTYDLQTTWSTSPVGRWDTYSLWVPTVGEPRGDSSMEKNATPDRAERQ